MTYNFITVGGATRDISFFTDAGVLIKNKKDILRQELLAFEYGAKIKVDEFYYTFGGGAANTAVNLANFGLKTACLTSIGDDENGKMILKNLKDRKVKVDLVKTKRGAQSGFSFILVTDKGERVIFANRGANKFLDITKKDLELLSKTKNIYIASLSGKWEANLRKLFSVKDANIFWNPNEAQYSSGLNKLAKFLKKTKVLFLNKDEAIELVLSASNYKKASNRFLNDSKNLLRILKSYGPEIVVITAGKNGVDAYDGTVFYHRDITKEKKRVDATGIGDAFNSTFSAGLEVYKGNIDKALTLALRNAASKIAHLGAQNGLIKFKK